jgi:hypothetical protein
MWSDCVQVCGGNVGWVMKYLTWVREISLRMENQKQALLFLFYILRRAHADQQDSNGN